jgi:glucose-1-phosphate cytidylyltransferase
MDGQTITAFTEKPDQENAYISGGFMVLDRRIRDYLGDDDGCVFEKGPMERLVREGQLKAYRHDGFWQCMDTYREQQMLDRMWQAGRAPWKTW